MQMASTHYSFQTDGAFDLPIYTIPDVDDEDEEPAAL